MRSLIALATVTVALVASATASAGGWASVGMNPLPNGVGPGDPWNTNLTILRHGVTPLTGLSPTISITRDGDGLTETFIANETNEPGVYTATVVFPEEGSWRIVADSSFGDSRLTYGPVQIETPTVIPGTGTGGSDDAFPVVAVLALLGGLAFAAAAAVLGIVRQRRLHPAG
jgi:hypothetical protein